MLFALLPTFIEKEVFYDLTAKTTSSNSKPGQLINRSLLIKKQNFGLL